MWNKNNFMLMYLHGSHNKNYVYVVSSFFSYVFPSVCSYSSLRLYQCIDGGSLHFNVLYILFFHILSFSFRLTPHRQTHFFFFSSFFWQWRVMENCLHFSSHVNINLGHEVYQIMYCVYCMFLYYIIFFGGQSGREWTEVEW
jgi:hypothetical protein